MKCIVLAAGYAKRLWPLTKNCPKGLLDVNGKPIMQYNIEKALELEGVDCIYIVTNEKFYKNFKEWADNFSSDARIKVINDGTTSEETKLGAIGDLQFVIRHESIDDDILVLNADNLVDFSYKPVYNYFMGKKKNVIALIDMGDKEKAKQGAVVELDDDNKVIGCEEKPEEPKTTLLSGTIFFFPKPTLKRIAQYLKEGNNPDSPGYFP